MVHNHLLALSQTFHLTQPGVTTPINNKYVATLQFIKYMSNIIGILSIVAIIYFILQIIFAGYAFLSSQGDTKMIETSRTRITEGILGLFVVIVAVGLGSLIATILGFNDPLNIPKMFTDMGL